ncbi:UNVERIFIED_CONTAM: Retrovirus-related Pol polyprotein from transposon.6 [Sesamum radiatum]|uniref:RNA-directed DNA polymerase n=1 Tax=Sesamum radiatum TaxID=300843 RepID=A0AAW2T1T4_SESRA
MTEFNKLHHETTVGAYLEKFEELKDQMLIFNKNLEEEFFTLKFISGLKDEVKSFVSTCYPTSLNQAVVLARKQEHTVNAILRKAHQPNRNTQPKPPYKPPNKSPPPRTNPQTRRFLTEAEVKAKKEKNLCYRCDEPYVPGHRCKYRQFYMLLSDEEAIEYNKAGQDEYSVGEEDARDVTVSLHAMKGDINCKTLRMNGLVGDKEILILIDCGSTHCFVDEKVAGILGCKLEETTPMVVRVADGSKLVSRLICPGFSWEMQGNKFTHPVRLLKIGGYDLVLGCDWLSNYNPVELDFHQLRITLNQAGGKLILKTLSNEPRFKIMAAHSLGKLLRRKNPESEGELVLMSKPMNRADEDFKISELLQQYNDIFKEPSSLPPEREIEHRIELLPEAIPRRQHPYRYAYGQKTEIEKIVKEMLNNGIIKPSQSSFASPVLLVKKKDGGWRLCVDYRYLNKLTIKHNFPIPVIDELLDELHGAKYFSKIDLRSGYFQIRMRKEDIPKTSFITHSGHYEFLVMPFGLCNAPSTFQALMNTVFEPYLRKFVLVFFDDILIYSKDWGMHLVHLKKVLELLRKHQLYAKKSKCSFAQLKVDYLGHIISCEGVSTDPQKIECMVNWPTPTTIKALRGFLGLTGYYRKFIKGYGTISKPLTSLLKKDAFGWNAEAEIAFNQLKEMMGRPIAYLSKALAPKNLGLSTYEKEFFALLLAVTKWKHYLQVHYKKGNENRAADALSRVEHEEVNPESNAITTQIPLWVQELQNSYEGNTLFQTVIQAKTVDIQAFPDYTYESGLLQPLPIPDQAWSCISMDFIEGLPNSEGKDSILVVVDRLTKYSHFLALKHPYTAASVAKIFFDNIYKLHGLPATPFQALYGYPPHQLIVGPYLQSHHTEVEGLIQERTKVMQLLKDNLHLAQQRMKLYADKRRSEREFEVGDEVFLKLQPYRQTSVALRKQLKLSAKYFGPYKILEKVGKVAYKLALPPEAKIHPVFHVSLLKKKIGSRYFPSVSLPEFEDEVFKVHPVAILARRLVPRNNVGVAQVLIQWSHASPDQATWEDYSVIAARFPGFDPWGQGTKKMRGECRVFR